MDPISTPNRRRFFEGAALAGLGAFTLTGCSRDTTAHGEHGLTEDTANLTPDQALAKLADGNARFVEMSHNDTNNTAARMVAVSKGQKPFVGILACVDSRVPPELVFDRGLGDVFDARIAGAIPDPAAIGSLEFGVEEFGVPLLVVLGHTKCGAVTAAVKASRSGQSAAPGLIGAVVDPILPAVKAVEAQGITGDAVINAAAKEVVRRSADALHTSPVLAERISAGKLRIAGAFYDLDTGKVDFFH